MNKKKKIIIIASSAFAAIIIVGFLYLQFVMLTHDLPEPGDEFTLSDSVKKTIQENVDNGKHQSFFVGIINGDDIDYYHYGTIEKDGKEIDENTIFEIGSISKVFTTLILADMIEKNEISLDDPIDKFLPNTVKTPSKDGKKITLLDLARHTSGMPTFPDDFPIWDLNKHHEYDKEKMYDYLERFEPSREIGSQYEYSNMGNSLLGHILSLHTGKDYEELLKERIIDELEMTSTCIKQCDHLIEQFATPHLLGEPIEELNLSKDMVSAGEIRSSGKDMLSFLSYSMGLKESSLKNAFETAQAANHEVNDDLSVGLAWHISENEGRKIIWHNGGTNGFSSFMGFDPESNQGILILTNSRLNVDDVAIWLFQHGPDSN
ncbi:MAG: serine hydrolase domain-containing protein [Nitrosopumilus sp.]